MPALKKGTLLPSHDEERQIAQGLAADTDSREWTDHDFSTATAFAHLPEAMKQKLRGRPKALVTKERISIRLSNEVLEQFRATGDGWQTRIDLALKDWLKTHRPV